MVFAVTAGGGTLSATSTTTDANGQAASTLTLGTSAGTNTVQVSVQGISQSATFTADAVDEATAVALEVSPTEVAEDAGTTTLTVTGTLNGAALTTATDVRLAISGTATRDVDYSALVGLLTIPAGSVSGTATLTLSLVDDSVDEDDETVIITATTTSGLTLSPSSLTVTITDNDTSVSASTTVCNRTPQVRDAIVAAVSDVSTCVEVTQTHLATGITSLLLNDQGITALQAGDFEGLTGLEELRLYDNQLSTLPADLFDGLTALTTLYLNGNQLSSLPDGLFEGLTALATLYLYGNSVDPLPLTASLEKVGADQVKAVAPTGAPFEIVLPLTVANGSLSGGATTITIPGGGVESQLSTVTRTLGTSAAVTVDIGTLPRPPTNHSGYTLVKSTDLPLEIIGEVAVPVTILDANLRAKIETALGKASGDPISAAEMATLTALVAQDAAIGDLTGLETATNLTELQLWDNNIADISAVAGLTKLTKLYLWGNAITDISHVAALTNLTDLRLGENSIANVSAVTGLTNLTHLGLRENAVSDIAAVAGLTNLTELRIGDNTISSISAVTNLTKLVWLDAPNNSISDLAAVTNLTNLTSLNLSGNSISDLSAVAGLTNLLELVLAENSVSDLSPLVANTGLGADTEIDVQGNLLDYPSIYTHIPALQARSVYIDFDNRTPTTLVKVSGDTQQGTPSTALTQPLVIEVQDANSVAFAGVPVVFTITAGGGTLSATNTTTDANGQAQSTLTLGNSAGTNTVQASAQGIAQTETFTAEATTTNTAPVFTDGESTTRTIAENTAADVNIGTAIAATDADNDALTYTLSGTDAAAFTIDSTTGQLQTNAALDYETKTSYSVVVTVSDGGLTDTITVAITVTDLDEQPQQPEGLVLTARFEKLPTSHDGSSFKFELHFSEEIEISFVNMRDDVLDVTGGTVTGARRLESGSNVGWEITIESASDAAVSIVLPPTPDCEAAGAACTDDGRTLSNRLTATVSGPAILTGGICDRTPQVQTAILGVLQQQTPSPSTCGEVTETHLATGITSLYLNDKSITALQAGDFEDLTSLEELRLYDNQLSTLPADLFDGLTALTTLYLNGNQLTVLPDGLFDGLSSLTTLYLYGNAADPLPLTVSLEKVGTDQVKAVAPSGAPFEMVLPLSIANGSISGGATTLTIPAGSFESQPLTVTRTPGTSAAVTVDFGTLPGLPANHSGYTLAKSADLPLEMFSLLTGGICDRTAQVQTAILAAVPSVSTCDKVTQAHLAAITSLDLNDKSITSLQADDFSGLSSLEALYLGDNQLTSLPEKLFAGLSSLKDLYLHTNRLTSLPEKLFAGLSSLAQINLHTNQLTSLPEKLFAGLPSLTQLYLRNNRLTSLSADLFSELSSLQYLYLDDNQLTSLPAGVFSGPSSLTQLLLNNNQLTSLPAGVFRGLSTPTTLWLQENTVDPLPLTVSLEKVGEGQFKAIVPAGALFDIVLPLRIVDGTITGGANSITIPAGRVESDVFTVTRTPGTTSTVTVDIGTLPELPTDHQGYQLAKSTDLPLAVISPPANTAPVFTDGTSTTRTIAENTAAGVHIGTAIAATDADNDVLTYTLGGTDAASFAIDGTTGQLKTSAALDYETKSSYSVAITVSDGSLTDTITVTINVTDIEEAIDRTTFESSTPSGYTEVTLSKTGTVWGVPTQYASGSDVGTLAFIVLGTLKGCSFANAEADRPSKVYIKTQDLGQLNSFGSATACGTTTSNASSSFNGVRITHLRFFDESSPSNVKEAVYNAATGRIEIPGESIVQQPEQPEEPVNVTLSISTASPLTEETLDESIVTLTLSGGAYQSSRSRIRDAVTVSGIDGVTVRRLDVDRVSDTVVTVELTFDGTDFDTDATLTVIVGAGAIEDYDGSPFTAQIVVTATIESEEVGDSEDQQPEPEAPEDSNSRAAFESSTPAGYTRETLSKTGTAWGVPTQFTDDSAVGTLAFMVLGKLKGCSFANAEAARQSKVYIKTQDLGSQSNYESETVCGTTTSSYSSSWNGVRITHLRFFDESSTPNIKEVVYNAATGQIEIPGESIVQQPEQPEQPEEPEQPEALGLTARFEGMPASHDGSSFTFELHFSEEIAISFKTLRDTTLDVTGGVAKRAQRLQAGSSLGWQITIEPDSTNAQVLIVLSPTDDCEADGAVCTEDGQPLSNSLVAIVPGSEQPDELGAPTITASTATPLTEATLHESVVTLTLSSGAYESSRSRIRGAVTVAGIAGVTVRRLDVDRVSDTVVTVELTFDGTNFDTDATLTFIIGADAIAEYDDSPLTAQIAVAASIESEATEDDGDQQPDSSDEDDGDQQPDSPEQPEEAVLLTASFEDMPETHDGSAFTFRVAFSEDIGISFQSLREDAFTVTGGAVTRGRRVDDRRDLFEITVEPDGDGDVTITLEPGRECGVSGAICTKGENRRKLTNTPTATVRGPDERPPPLTARFEDMLAAHDGSKFSFELHFSEKIVISYKTLRDTTLDVTGGTVTGARRLVQGSNLGWEITIEPDSDAEVLIVLPATTDCEAAGAICTEDGRPLSNELTAIVPGPAAKPVVAPRTFGLDANYPNPFNAETQLVYTLPMAGPVELAIYNVMGQRVRTLVQGVQAAGRYQIAWDGRSDSGSSPASGVYLSRLVSDQGVQVRRLLLLK